MDVIEEEFDESEGSDKTAGPIDRYLSGLHARLRDLSEGEIAAYIPELAKVDPDLFGIAIATVDGKVYRVGDADETFTIQSISKPFIYGYILAEYGREAVLNHVGVEPTGDAYNSILLDEVENRPFNPMVNSGAMAAAELIKGESAEARIATMLDVMSRFAGRSLFVDEDVFRSEQGTGHRNRAIAYMMLNSGMIRSSPESILDIYFRQCSVRVTCCDLAIMAATLANNGVNPITGNAAIPREYVQDVLTVMNSCGMYNFAGQWSYEIGMPAKSGVSGGIIAIIPGQIGIGVFSPRLDRHGHSVRGVRVCREISENFGLHVFRNLTNAGASIRRELFGDVVHSKRQRTPEERRILDNVGRKICIVEIQGSLYFGSAERLVRRIDELCEEADYVIADFRRVHDVDQAACKLLLELTEWLAARDRRLLYAHVDAETALQPLLTMLRERYADLTEIVFAHRDIALEWCENRLIATDANGRDLTKFSLGDLNIFAGMSPEGLKVLESATQPMIFEPGQAIVKEGDEARLFFVIARGKATVCLRLSGAEGEADQLVRLATLGPGLTFGEMALLDGGRRSADVVAEERVVCYGFSVDHLRDLSQDHPEIFIVILGNMMRDFSERLRRANDQIRALEN